MSKPEKPRDLLQNRVVERIQVTLEPVYYAEPLGPGRLELRVDVRCGDLDYHIVEALRRDDTVSVLEFLLDLAKRKLMSIVRDSGLHPESRKD